MIGTAPAAAAWYERIMAAAGYRPVTLPAELGQPLSAARIFRKPNGPWFPPPAAFPEPRRGRPGQGAGS